MVPRTPSRAWASRVRGSNVVSVISGAAYRGASALGCARNWRPNTAARGASPPILFRVDYQLLLKGAMAAAVATAGQGRVADYIPALATVEPDVFGLVM